MNRILFDTSVYGRLIHEPEVLEKIKEGYKKEFILYGCSTIRNKLRKTPKNIILRKKKAQIMLLEIYDSFILKDNHNLKYNKLVEDLVTDYIREYKGSKGNLSEDSIKTISR